LSDYRVNLDTFAGPMDLLLYLIRKDEVDVYDIPISKITDQYVRYIDMLKDFDIDLAGDFLVMAATLMHIKSAMLLPKGEAEEVSEEGGLIDPRSELIGQLLEYKKFKDAANLLESAAQSKEDRFSRPSTIIDGLKGESEPELDKDDTPIDLYQIDILNNLQLRGPMSFGSIFEGVPSKVRMVGLFLALLELSRGELIWIEQDESSKTFIIKALTDEPAEEAVQRAILATEEEELLWMQEQMEKRELVGRMAVEAGAGEDEGQQADLEDVELEEEGADLIEPIVESLVELGNDELAESVAGAGIPIVELPAEKKKRPIVVENGEIQEVSQVGPVPIVELPAGLNAVEKQHHDSEEKLAEDYSN